MKEQVERIEIIKERNAANALGIPSEFKGCKYFSFCNRLSDESSLGMINTRVSDIGRRLTLTAKEDEKHFPFAVKRGYTFGVSTRS